MRYIKKNLNKNWRYDSKVLFSSLKVKLRIICKSYSILCSEANFLIIVLRKNLILIWNENKRKSMKIKLTLRKVISFYFFFISLFFFTWKSFLKIKLTIPLVYAMPISRCYYTKIAFYFVCLATFQLFIIKIK